MEDLESFTGKRVLFVDDEELACEFAAEVLKDAGCTVCTAEDGGAAGRVFSDEGGQFDLVITDWRMPRVNGRDLILNLRRNGYDGHVILASSHINEGNTHHFHSAFQVKHLLPKPFTAEQLTEKVAAVFGRG